MLLLLRFVGDVHNARDCENYENWKTVRDAWPLCAPCTELESADIVAVILIYLALAHIQRRATY